MADAKLSVNDLMQFLPDFRESLNIREIAFSLLAKSVIRLDQCASLTNGPANDEKVERLVKLLQALEMSPAKPSGVHHFIISLRETGENNHIRGHVDLLSKISSISPMLKGEEEIYEDGAPKVCCMKLMSVLTCGIIYLYYCHFQVVPPPALPQKTIAGMPLPPPPSVPPPSKTIAVPEPILPPVPPHKPPPASGSSSPMTEIYHAAVAGVQPAKPKGDTAYVTSVPPPIPPAKSPAKVDSDEDGYESWPGTTAKDLSNGDIGDKLYEDFPTPKNEEEIYKNTVDLIAKPSLQNQLYPDYSTEEEEEDEEEEEEEEDQYEDITKKLADQQKKSLQSLTEDKQDTTASDGKHSYEPEDYHPSTDNDSALSDYIHHWVPHDEEKSHDSIPKGTNKPPLKPPASSDIFSSVSKPPLKHPTSGVISGDVEVRNSANMTAEMTNKDDEVTKRLQDPSTSDTTVSELRQSLIAENDSNAKTQESQMTKAHKLEMKDLDLKYKTEMKQLQLKQEEETLAMKVEINKLKSELNGVYKQNSKLAEHVKKSCKREEMFDQVVKLLQDTVSNLQTEMNELLATLESTKEKLRKYESMAT